MNVILMLFRNNTFMMVGIRNILDVLVCTESFSSPQKWERQTHTNLSEIHTNGKGSITV